MNSNWLNDDERHMIQKCISGDPFYEKKLYVTYVNAMYNRAVRITGNNESGKDALQEAFIEVFKSLSKFRGESTLGAWIKRIVIHTCLKQLKKEKRTEALDNWDAKVTEETEELELKDIQVKLIHQAIKKLPDGCRNVFNLYLMEGYGHKEIAQIMDISESTSKTQYKRAKMILKDVLKKQIHE